jgi:hypothetical protein
MRILLTGIGIAVATLAADIRTGSAQGYDNNWCISEGVHGAGSLDCSYVTFQQCLWSQSGNGGTCVENPDRLWERAGRTSGRGGQRSNQGGRY